MYICKEENKMKLFRQNLINLLREEMGMKDGDAHKVVVMIFDEIRTNIEAGNSYSIKNFGVFRPKLSKGRKWTSLGKTHQTQDRYLPKFTAAKEFRADTAKIKEVEE